MILILFSSILIIATLSGIGRMMEIFSETLYSGISAKILTGILATTITWTLFAFFIPINIYVEIPTIALGLFFFFKDRVYLEFYQFSKRHIQLLIAIVLVILFSGSYYPYILDHYGYYVPSIKWLTEYGLVKGISNLDLTLGQMSAWHIFQAGFSNFSDPFLRINTVILIVYAIYIIEKRSWIQLVFLPVMLLFSQSPSPDLPVIIFSLIILNEIVSGNNKTSLLFTFSIFVFTIKPTMIWLPILSLFYSTLIVKAHVKNFIWGTLIIILFFIKNIWTFGYPIFPVSIGDLGISWKPNPEILKTSSRFAVQKTYDMQYTFEEIQKFSLLDYIKNWLFLNGIKSKINILFIVSLFSLILYSLKKRKRIVYLITISLVIKTVLVLLFSAQYRFFIDAFFVIFFILFSSYFNEKRSLITFSALSFFVIIFLSFPAFFATHLPSYKMANFMADFEKKQIYQPSVYKPTDYHSFKVGDLHFNVSKNYPYTFASPLPAMTLNYMIENAKTKIFPQPVNKNNLKKGFIWKKMNDKEIKDTQHIINTIINTDK
ncbi:hypothetical protein CEY12_10795 [Chryseobacterium sp. T16E-39]|uniref:LIC_10190 family membrane protein n=1 Tax=Chryseobacterium sp. T16E-39 TaxID=2015076 RepID=UPI000B5B35FB|nr:hypothetical protein [Chryseobacterium sp. T16E-39]ASK30566.1 hypothetical protein CEY12_10795 [Chryseobacterium sp. T16E-39]